MPGLEHALFSQDSQVAAIHALARFLGLEPAPANPAASIADHRGPMRLPDPPTGGLGEPAASV